VEDEDDAGRGQVGRVVPVLALVFARVRHGAIEADLVGGQLVEAVDSLQQAV
jgi:hypothetical protein